MNTQLIHAIFCVMFALSPMLVHDVAAQSDATAVYRKTEASVFLIYLNDRNGQPTALGSGFLVGPRLVITNAHVVASGTPVLAVGPVRIPAKVLKIDEQNDLSLLSVDVDLTSKPLVVSPRKLVIGDKVFVIGNPEGLEKTLSEGLISSFREVEGRKLLQITTPISHGSSGGPVIDTDGQVVGVIVSMLKEGQNLNFAIPASTVSIFLASKQENTTANAASLLRDLENALDKRTEVYSTDESSEYQKKTKAITQLMDRLLKTDDPAGLIKLAHIAQNEDYDLSLAAATKAEALKPSSDSKLGIAQALNFLAIFKTGDEQAKDQLKAAKYAEEALKASKVQTRELLCALAWSKEQLGDNKQAFAFYTKALEAPSGPYEISNEVVLRGLIRNATALKLSNQRRAYFERLGSSGKASAEEWSDEAYQLVQDGDQLPSAVSDFEIAGTLSEDGIYWCRAALNLTDIPRYSLDRLLKDGKACLTKEALSPTKNIKDLNGVLATVNVSLSNALNTRGVYSEALNYAREATKLEPAEFSAFDAMADSLYYLQRYTESVTAEKEAIRLSDGKYWYTHFRLGTAYFELDEWRPAQESFEKAFEQNPRNEIAAYDVALCYQRQSYFRDAAQWYRKVLQVNPNREDKADILKNIEALSR